METHRAVVFPWHCDHIGHMNVRWYAHAFDDAGFHLWMRIGLGHVTLRQRGIATVVARTETDFRHEASVGELLVVRGAFVALGTKSITHTQRMTDAESGELRATQRTVEVFFELEKRTAIPIPPDLREKLTAVLVPEPA